MSGVCVCRPVYIYCVCVFLKLNVFERAKQASDPATEFMSLFCWVFSMVYMLTVAGMLI